MNKLLRRQSERTQVVEKLRSEKMDQFLALVRMHMSFILPDLDADMLNCLGIEQIKEELYQSPVKKSLTKRKKSFTGYLQRLSLAQRTTPLARADSNQSIVKKRVSNHRFSVDADAQSTTSHNSKRISALPEGGLFGAPLSQEGIAQIFQIIEYLRCEDCLKEEGLFRKSGAFNRMQVLLDKINSGNTLDLTQGSHFSATPIFTPHDAATVLKHFLKCLPEPLLLSSHFDVFRKISGLQEVERPELLTRVEHSAIRSRQLKAMQLLVVLLPQENHQLLRAVLDLLDAVMSKSDSNLMTAPNLSLIFAPLFMCPKSLSPDEIRIFSTWGPQLVELMLSTEGRVFDLPSDLVRDSRHASSSLAGTPIRRHFSAMYKTPRPSDPDTPEVITTTAFADQARSQADAMHVNTEGELARLHAYVQQMPDSAQKQRMIKTFKKHNRTALHFYEPRSPITSRIKASFKKGLRRGSSKQTPGSAGSSGGGTVTTAESMDSLHIPVRELRRGSIASSRLSLSRVSLLSASSAYGSTQQEPTSPSSFRSTFGASTSSLNRTSIATQTNTTTTPLRAGSAMLLTEIHEADEAATPRQRVRSYIPLPNVDNPATIRKRSSPTVRTASPAGVNVKRSRSSVQNSEDRQSSSSSVSTRLNRQTSVLQALPSFNEFQEKLSGLQKEPSDGMVKPRELLGSNDSQASLVVTRM